MADDGEPSITRWTFEVTRSLTSARSLPFPYHSPHSPHPAV